MSRQSVPDEGALISSAAYRYGMLAVILGLLAWDVHLYLSLPPGYHGDPYGNFVTVLMLLFNHLAFAFKWRRSVSIGLQIVACVWLVFGFFYVVYLGRVLYPIHMPGAS